MSKHLVIVGGGQACAQLVQSSRLLGFDGRISVVGEEDTLPYQRPPLSKKYLSGDLDRDRLFVRPANFYVEKQVELLTGEKAIALDPAKQRLTLQSETVVDYDFLALATGASPRLISVPGIDLDGVSYLRTLADVDQIKARLSGANSVVIVGAGYIGLEVAASCRAAGLEVTVLEAAPRILGRVVCDTTAEFFRAYHERMGVRIVCDAQVSAFSGNTKVETVQTVTGESYPCDLAIIGIGVLPRTELAEAAGLRCDNGIAVDPNALTSAANIYGLGDCASYPHPWVGTRIRLESVQNALEMAKTVAHSLFGEPRPFADVPWFWSDQFALKLQIAGIAQNYNKTVVRGDVAADSFAVYYLEDSRLVAVDAINCPKDFILAKKLLTTHTNPPATAIADTTADLGEFIA